VTTPIDDLADRATGYGMTGVIVDGQDVDAVHETIAAAIGRARSGAGPTLVEAKTYRLRGHSRTDPGRYRPADEVDHWKQRDPLLVLGAVLAAAHVLGTEKQAEMRVDVQAEIDASAERAAASPIPKLEDLKKYVYVS
jgi:pyruvate dehydrogenase E1 component alpha subunit